MMDIAVDLIKLTLGGILGGIIAAYINERVFRRAAKHQDDTRRRDALRNILTISPTILRNVYGGWSRDIGPDETEQQRELMQRLHDQLAETKSQFIDNRLYRK